MSDVKDAVKLEPGEWVDGHGTLVVIRPYDKRQDGQKIVSPSKCPFIGEAKGNPNAWNGYSPDGRLFGTSGESLSHIVRRADAKDSRIAELQAKVACLTDERNDRHRDVVHIQGELDAALAQLATYRDKALWKLILKAYGNAPFGTDHAKVVADAKAMLRTMEGGAV